MKELYGLFVKMEKDAPDMIPSETSISEPGTALLPP